MASAQSFVTFGEGAAHSDFVHDMAYDHYGKRLATCSSDHKVKVWSQDAAGEWQCEAELKHHSSSVWKLAWAHPEFGQVLASCSFDRNVVIWEEHDVQVLAADGSTIKQGRWNLAATLVDSRESVNDVKFAPRHLGLKLATCSADGFVRIYEANDVMNLSHWQITDEFEAAKQDATSISWNQSQFDAQMLVVGCSDGTVRVWGYNDEFRRWQALADLDGHAGSVNDVSWAPNLGRTYNLIATASSDQSIRLFKLQRADDKTYTATLLEDLPQKTDVWRAEWNVLGTVLATSGDDGCVRLWRSNFRGRWDCVSEIVGSSLRK